MDSHVSTMCDVAAERGWRGAGRQLCPSPDVRADAHATIVWWKGRCWQPVPRQPPFMGAPGLGCSRTHRRRQQRKFTIAALRSTCQSDGYYSCQEDDDSKHEGAHPNVEVATIICQLNGDSKHEGAHPNVEVATTLCQLDGDSKHEGAHPNVDLMATTLCQLDDGFKHEGAHPNVEVATTPCQLDDDSKHEGAHPNVDMMATTLCQLDDGFKHEGAHPNVEVVTTHCQLDGESKHEGAHPNVDTVATIYRQLDGEHQGLTPRGEGLTPGYLRNYGVSSLGAPKHEGAHPNVDMTVTLCDDWGQVEGAGWLDGHDCAQLAVCSTTHSIIPMLLDAVERGMALWCRRHGMSQAMQELCEKDT